MSEPITMNEALLPMTDNERVLPMPYENWTRAEVPFDEDEPAEAVPSIPEDFGVKSTGVSTATIYGGTVVFGNTPIIVTDTDLSITTETAYVYWELATKTMTLTLLAASSVPTNSTDADGYLTIRRPLWLLAKDATTNAVSVTRKTPAYILPGNFA